MLSSYNIQEIVNIMRSIRIETSCVKFRFAPFYTMPVLTALLRSLCGASHNSAYAKFPTKAPAFVINFA